MDMSFTAHLPLPVEFYDSLETKFEKPQARVIGHALEKHIEVLIRQEAVAQKEQVKKDLLNELATKADLANVRSELKQDIAEVRTELANVRSELKQDLLKTRLETRYMFIGIMVLLALTNEKLLAIIAKVLHL